MSDFLRQFAPTFATLDKHNLHLLGRLYSEDVAFADPLHEVQGLPALQRYFADLYSNVSELNFDFHGFDTVAEGEGYLRWTMRFRHPRLAGGQVIEVPRFTAIATTSMPAPCSMNMSPYWVALFVG